MARDVGEGFILVNERTFQRFDRGQLDQLAFELDRALRDVRADQPDLEDIPAIQIRNRKLSRLTGALTMLRSFQQRRFRREPAKFDGKA
jgi:hypothetical protein